jgi:hypothetical protein
MNEDIDIYLVESDYTVVFFTAGGKHTPGWNWVWKAYRSLSRKYRKHLKRLVYIFPTSLSPYDLLSGYPVHRPFLLFFEKWVVLYPHLRTF